MSETAEESLSSVVSHSLSFSYYIFEQRRQEEETQTDKQTEKWMLVHVAVDSDL